MTMVEIQKRGGTVVGVVEVGEERAVGWGVE